MISFYFSGWAMADITSVYDLEKGEDVSVIGWDEQQVVDGLNSGKFSINFAAVMALSKDGKTELSDFEIEREI